MTGTEAVPGRQYHYFVDGVKYETTQVTITGAEIKSKIPNLDPSYALYLEGQGTEPDKLITDTDSIILEKGPHKLYTVPPASFGAR
jgi:hypothetical protein